MTRPRASLDMHPVLSGLIDATHAASDLDDLVLDVDGPGGTRRPEVAEATRSLLALADRLDLLSALVRQEYWLLKGQRRVETTRPVDTLDQSLKHYL